MERRLIVEQFDPGRPKPGGIDTCLRGLVRYCPPEIELWIAGVDAVGDAKLGEWSTRSLGTSQVAFMPLARLDHADLRRVVPHSAALTAALLRRRPLRDADVVQSHRINVGMAVGQLYRRAAQVQFLHSSGTENLGRGSKSYFKYARPAYRALERRVVPRTRETVVFSRAGSTRLAPLGNVQFSTTWFDPALFFPAPATTGGSRQPVRRLLWACRFEPAKDPLLALRALLKTDARVELTMAGSGTLLEKTRAAVRALGLDDRVHLVGPVDKDDMGELFRAHDALLMTSQFEGYSRAVVEALACDLPVLTTPGGEPNGLVREGVNGARLSADIGSGLDDALARVQLLPVGASAGSVSDHDAAVLVPALLRGTSAA